MIFSKVPAALAADGEPIGIPVATNQFDYEAELVIVIVGRAMCKWKRLYATSPDTRSAMMSRRAIYKCGSANGYWTRYPLVA